MILVMAWRNIWRNKMRSIIIIGSVALGILAGLFILALYQGMMQARVRIVIQNEVSHLQIHHPDFKKDYKASYTIGNVQGLLSELREMDEVANLSPRLITRGMLATSTSSSGVEIRGILPEEENRVSRLGERIVEGSYFPGARKNELLVGKKLADKKDLKLNTKVVLTFSDQDNIITSGAFRITGIFQSTNTALDERIVYIRQEDLAELLNTGQEVHEMAIVLKEDAFLDQVYEKLKTDYPLLLTQTWKQIAPETELLVTVTNQTSFIIIIIIMLTLTFGIINTMLMAILERTRETGMMIALGMSKIRLFFLVLLETVLLTIIGSPVGIGLAWVAIYYFSLNGIDISEFSGATMGDYGFEKIIFPVFPTEEMGKIVIIVAATAVLAAIMPAFRALRMDPVDALRQ